MIRTFNITNFRSCKETTLNLNDGITVLVGKNGVGKTNILQSIGWLAKAAFEWAPISRETISREKGVFGFQTTIQLGTREYDYEFRYTRSVANGQDPSGDLLWEKLLLDEGSGARILLEREMGRLQVPGSILTAEIPPLTPAIPVLLSLLSDTDPAREFLQELASFFRRVSYYAVQLPTEGSDVVEADQYEEWRASYIADKTLTDSFAMRLIYMWNEDESLAEEFRALIGQEGLGLIDSIDIGSFELPGRAPDGTIEAPITKLYYPTFCPSADMGGTGSYFGFRELSIGTQRVIRMVVSMLFDERSLMLIEQPEDSIHPGLLRKLLDLFRTYSDRSQLIFSTHSPTVLDMLRPSEVHLVTAPGGETHVRALSEVELAAAQEFLNDEGDLSDFYETLDND